MDVDGMSAVDFHNKRALALSSIVVVHILETFHALSSGARRQMAVLIGCKYFARGCTSVIQRIRRSRIASSIITSVKFVGGENVSSIMQ